MDGSLCPDDRRGREVRRVEHAGARGLERRTGLRSGGGDLVGAVQQLKREPGKGLLVGGVTLPLALAELGLIDEYELVVHPRIAGHGLALFAGLSKYVGLRLVSRLELGSGAVAMRYVPRA